jgi:hypothetical protein
MTFGTPLVYVNLMMSLCVETCSEIRVLVQCEFKKLKVALDGKPVISIGT